MPAGRAPRPRDARGRFAPATPQRPSRPRDARGRFLPALSLPAAPVPASPVAPRPPRTPSPQEARAAVWDELDDRLGTLALRHDGELLSARNADGTVDWQVNLPEHVDLVDLEESLRAALRVGFASIWLWVQVGATFARPGELPADASGPAYGGSPGYADRRRLNVGTVNPELLAPLPARDTDAHYFADAGGGVIPVMSAPRQSVARAALAYSGAGGIVDRMDRAGFSPTMVVIRVVYWPRRGVPDR